jgi:ubiquinone/menaquinone biosynthesis C-methylase UbiE
LIEWLWHLYLYGENVNKAVSKYYEESDRELAQRYIGNSISFGSREYFEAALTHRYSLYPEIPRIAAFDSFQGKDVLEIGVGQGADHVMFAKGGACLTGIDLTEKHCRMTANFLRFYSLKSNIRQADACDLPFPDRSFDHVYSCGVLLLINDIARAIAEIHRVLRPGGTATVMLYNKRSIHYWVKTRLYYGWVLGEDGAIGRQAVNDWCTDGPGYVKVFHYGPGDLKKLFTDFSDVRYETSCLTPEQLPEIGPPRDSRTREWLERHFGFFLWATVTKPIC